MEQPMKRLRQMMVWLLTLAALLTVAVRVTTFHPDNVQPELVTCPASAPDLQPGQDVSVMSWNVQYLAGTGYVFFYDLLDESGPDERPSAEDIAITLDQVADVIRAEQPDVVLVQELDDDATRTDGDDQLALLTAALGNSYPCSASAFYWDAAFVPHPRIMGSVGMKLSTISRFQIKSATRYQLPRQPLDIVTRQFEFHRAILETRLPVAGGEDLVLLNTHLDAFAQGSDTMQQQVALAAELLAGLTDAGEPWVFGGDMNLLPPGIQYDGLPAAQRAYYAPESELSVLTDLYASVPSLDEANGPDAAMWFTHQPNDPAVDGTDRTIDFLFHSPTLMLGTHRVLRGDALVISDHLPVIASYTLP
jgi:endonuclease/exonuclease/phosphatase family metal-dependent hydrolase